ncbi:hypothetical protein GOV04_03605 [Candidatus Woesearchaeota archaeon]|nr:hypothetical protein [Candidatus Woesearchaeota archaeon]
MLKKTKLKKEGQVAFEFLILVSFLFIMFTLFVYAISANMSRQNDVEEYLGMKDYAFTVQQEIRNAAFSLEGYQRTFHIPEKIGQENYSINITGDEVYLELETYANTYTVYIPRVNGTIQKGWNTIRKENGSIYLNI